MEGDSVMITVKFSCSLCGLHRVETEVMMRKKDQDAVEWMEYHVIPAVRRDHDRRSPGCNPTTLDELLIPMSGSKHIGGPVIN